MNFVLNPDNPPFEQAYQFSKERLGDLSFDEFKQEMQGWNISVIENLSGCVGVVIHKNGLVHICISQEWRNKWASKKLIKEILTQCANDGTVKTTVFGDDAFRKSFAERLGFKKTKKEANIELYEVTP